MYSYKYYIDSWIEISSTPSSSSLSSGGANDDIVTTGLNIQSNAQNYRRRRRRLQHLATAAAANINYSHRAPSGEGSSQDEYEESESESDRVLSSSNEDIASQPHELLHRENSLGSTSDATFSSDEDDASTALASNRNAPAFTPQPNVFSHSSTSCQTQAYTRAAASSNRSYVPASHSRPTATRTSTQRSSQASVRSSRHHRQQQQQQHSPYNMISPSHQADHDAALRASLSTLLSCAAAARGIPKNDSQPSDGRTSNENRVDPSSIRLVPGSAAMDDDNGVEQKGPHGRSVPTTESSSPNRDPSSAVPRHIPRQNKHAASGRSTNSPSPTTPSPKAKRKASSSKDRSSANRAASPSSKKSRRAAFSDSMSSVSPTLMTWVLSAGVVVLFSAVSFSTGYALGRQIGRTETGGGMGSFGADGGNGSGGFSGADCGSEAVKGGLRRLRWGSVTGSSVSV